MSSLVLIFFVHVRTNYKRYLASTKRTNFAEKYQNVRIIFAASVETTLKLH